MTLLSSIRSHQVQARKDRNAVRASLLTTLLGEAEMVGKNAGRETTDAEVVAVIKKFMNNIHSTLEVLSASDEQANSTLSTELGILSEFLPRQFTPSELRAAIINIKTEINAGPKDMGKIMALLKARHAGLYDGGQASMIIKSLDV